jgi:uncharacterized membrane protein
MGSILFGLGYNQILDSFWSGMGGALIAVGAVREIHILRYRKDEAYREKREIAEQDERNRFLRNKAWARAGYLFVLITAISTIVFKLLGQELLSMAVSFAVSILVLLYWICYLVLKKKYL